MNAHRSLMRSMSTILTVLTLAACGGAPSAAVSSSGSAASTKPAAAGPSTTAAKPKPTSGQALRPITVAYTTMGASATPLWLADTTHAFSDRGLNVSIKYVEGNLGVKALVAKEIDILLQAGAPIITADVNGPLDLVWIGSEYNHSQFSLNVQPSIKSAADLKGKPVGSDRAGSTTDYQTRRLLDQLKLQPSDVSTLAIGGTDLNFAALLSGQAQAATLSPPFTFQAEDKGYATLADTYKLPYQSVGPVVSRARIDELAPSLLVFLEGYRAGIRAYYAQPDLAKKVMQDNTKETNQAILQRTYDFYTKEGPFQDDLQPTMEGIKSMIDFLAETVVPAAKNAKPEQFVDLRFLSQLSK